MLIRKSYIFKGKKIGLNGEGLRLFVIGSSSPQTNSINLLRDQSKELIEVFIVIDYQDASRTEAKFYIVIEGRNIL